MTAMNTTVYRIIIRFKSGYFEPAEFATVEGATRAILNTP